MISELRKAGYHVGLISNGIQTITDILRRRLNADYCISHTMQYDREVATGNILTAPALSHFAGCDMHPCCRRNILVHFHERMGIRPDQILAIGGDQHDTCLLQAAGYSIGFQSNTTDVHHAATRYFSSSLDEIFPIIRQNPGKN
jgi:glucosyl-3-phosphoglycerate synthase